MKKKIQIISIGLIILNLQLISHNSFSQNVGINSDGSNPESGTMLDIKSSGTTSSTFGLKVKDSDGTNRAVVRSDGNVGIGVDEPRFSLDVVGSGVAISSVSAPRLLIDDNTSAFKIRQNGSGWGSRDLYLGRYNAAGDPSIIVTSGGRMAMRDLSPDALLEVSASGGGNDLFMLSSDDANDGDLVTVKNNGNVGIGTTAPKNKLDIEGGAVIGASYSGTNTAPTNGLLVEGDVAIGSSVLAAHSHKVEVIVGSGTGNAADHGLRLQDGNGSTPKGLKMGVNTTGNGYGYLQYTFEGTAHTTLALNPLGGNVGIGITNPSQRLTVFNGTTTGTYTTSGWQHSSDRRLKTNVVSIDNSIEKIVQLDGVYFNWKKNPKENRQIGFIAQEVEKTLPEVVVKDKEGKYTMAYGNLTAVLVNAIKEQQQTIEDLKQANKALEARVDQKDHSLELRIHQLEEILKTVNK